MDNTIIFYIISTTSTAFLFFLGVLYKSKCTNINLCYGLIDIDRNVEIEEKYDEFELNHTDNNKI
jgi:hypothetical protein